MIEELITVINRGYRIFEHFSNCRTSYNSKRLMSSVKAQFIDACANLFINGCCHL